MRLLRYLLWAVFAVVAAMALSWIVYMPDRSERGVWIDPATGNIIELGALRARLYHQSEAACTYDTSFPAHLGLVYGMVGASIRVENDRLELAVDGTLSPTLFERINALPEACAAEPDASPASVFEAFWTAMDENYAFFDLHGVDWNLRRSFAPREGEDLSDEMLFRRMKDALTGLEDSHVQLVAGHLGYWSPRSAPHWMPDPPLSRSTLNQIARDAIGIPLRGFDYAPLEYGLREDGIGYMLIYGMWTEPGFGKLDSDLSRDVMATVATELAAARGLIVDIRYNPGGNDSTAFAYAGHFIDEPRTVLTKRTRLGNGWTDSFDATVLPAPDTLRFDQPVVVLTSRLTGSGAEIFTLALRGLPNVTVMGEETDGGLSDILGVPLPNGWRLGLSNQEYRAPDGSLFEGTGVPPDVFVSTDASELQAGRDPIMQAAIDYLKSN